MSNQKKFVLPEGESTIKLIPPKDPFQLQNHKHWVSPKSDPMQDLLDYQKAMMKEPVGRTIYKTRSMGMSCGSIVTDNKGNPIGVMSNGAIRIIGNFKTISSTTLSSSSYYSLYPDKQAKRAAKKAKKTNGPRICTECDYVWMWRDYTKHQAKP